MNHVPNFVPVEHCPTPEEIAELCLEIQKTWTPYERYRRTVTREPTWEVPTASHAGVRREIRDSTG